MASTVLAGAQSAAPARGPHLDEGFGPIGAALFAAGLLGGLAYVGLSIFGDTRAAGETIALGTVALLGLALLIALGFEFVNGFHDTANAVATVIYTRSLSAPFAVVWSGLWNFIGVMLSSGAVAYGIIALLPVDLVLNTGSGAGFAMIFALLLSAIGWNLATWWVGLPNSSSHALIGSILGVGLANGLLSGRGASLDWGQVEKVFTGLLIAPLIGFVGAWVLLKVMRAVVRDPQLYREPDALPPPPGVRALLVATCTAVSFAHGSNDGQKGMGLIMLILIGCAPTAYALNRSASPATAQAVVAAAGPAQGVFERRATGEAVPGDAARPILAEALGTSQVGDGRSFAALAGLSRDVSARLAGYGSLGGVPAEAAPEMRNDLYLLLDATKLIVADPKLRDALPETERQALKAYADRLESATRYIPDWVKVAVALALGLGTMVGWRRIVVTVGEKIGKTHMTYGMGASAEMMAASTIVLASEFGLPVSTTHVLSSGVAGASVANGAGLQARTLRNMGLAWVTTLPATIALSGGLYWLFLRLVG